MRRLRASARLAFAAFLALGIVDAGSAADRVGGAHIQATVATLAVARHARSLADTASTRTRADTSAEAMAASRAAVDADAAEARRQLDVLAGAGHEHAAQRIRELLDALVQSAQGIEDGRHLFAGSLRDSRSSREKLIAATSWQLLPAALASEDDLSYRMLSEPGAVAVEDLLLYARLALLTQQIDQGYIALEVATRQTDSEFIGTVEEAANLVMYQLRENIESFTEAGQEDLDPGLVPLARDLVEAAYGETNLIDLMKTRLRLDEREAQLAGAVDAASSSLQIELDAVFEQAIGDLELADTDGETAKALRAALAVSRHAAAAASPV